MAQVWHDAYYTGNVVRWTIRLPHLTARSSAGVSGLFLGVLAEKSAGSKHQQTSSYMRTCNIQHEQIPTGLRFMTRDDEMTGIEEKSVRASF